VRVPCVAAIALVLTVHAQQPAAPPPPQTPLTTFRSSVDLIQADVVVLDKDRRPVTGLTAGDFSIQLDGKPAPIDAFAAITLPESARTDDAAAWTREVSSDVSTNQHRNEGRLVVIVMDRTIPAGTATLTARAIARAAVDALGPRDVGAVVRTSSFTNEGLSQGFTADKARLRAAIDAPFMGQTAPPEMTERGLVYVKPEQERIGDCPYGACVHQAIRRVAEAMTGITGRQKTIVFVGADISMPDSEREAPEALKEAYKQAVRALDAANVTLHAVDPTGLESLAVGFTPTGKPTARYTPSDNLKRQGNLAVLPSHTGGRTVVNTNAPQDAVPQIFEETRAYYLIGVRRTDAKTKAAASGEIRIRVNRDDAIVRSRRSYYAAAAAPVERAPGDVLERAIAPLFPVNALPLEIGLLPIFQPSGEPAVSLLLRIGASTESGNGTGASPVAGPFDALIGVFDMQARKVASVRHSIEAPAAVGGAGFEWMSYFPLKPGRYEVRVAVAPTAGVTASSVYGYVDVPELMPGALAMSGVRFESAPEAGRPQPTLRRRFAEREAIDAFVQVRRAEGSRLPLSVRVSVIDGRDVVVVEKTTELDDGAFTAEIAGYRYSLPLSELRPGRYLLRIEAKQSTIVGREVPFVVGDR
jgi:VWFA-related protein